jgi:hypothetical protein
LDPNNSPSERKFLPLPRRFDGSTGAAAHNQIPAVGHETCRRVRTFSQAPSRVKEEGLYMLLRSGAPDGGDLSGQPWSQADLFFLMDALRRGLSVAQVAGFLGRTEDEVRGKAEKLMGD